LPEISIFKLFGIHPQPYRRIAGSNEFCEDPAALLFTISDLKMPPTLGGVASSPFGTEQVGELLFTSHGKN
jgi:hypothetical protein